MRAIQRQAKMMHSIRLVQARRFQKNAFYKYKFTLTTRNLNLLTINASLLYYLLILKLGKINMSKAKSFFAILIPSATVFISSACIMILELVAGRLIARHLGSSLYTWTSVIGVVLAGITIGNYLGGRIADRFTARKALAVLFAVSSVACVVIVTLNNLVSQWTFLWTLSWPMRVFSHICLVFLIP